MNDYHKEMRFPDESFLIVGAAMKVHSTLGPGFTEKVYQDALAIEFQEQGIPFKRETELHASYKGRVLDGTYKPDFICFEPIPGNDFSGNRLGKMQQCLHECRFSRTVFADDAEIVPAVDGEIEVLHDCPRIIPE